MRRPASQPTDPYRRFCRAAAVAFGLVALYTLVVKAPSGQMERDWVHTALHVVTGAVAAHAGWMSAHLTPARLFTVALPIGYGSLGTAGWFIDGLLLGTRFAIPLGVADNVFHLLLAGAAAAVLVYTHALAPAAARRRS